MHFGDKPQTKKNHLTGIFYTHTEMCRTTGGRGYVEIQTICLESIHSAKFFSPSALCDLGSDDASSWFDEFFLDELEPEEWYKIKLRQKKNGGFKVLKCKNVSQSKSEFDRLH